MGENMNLNLMPQDLNVDTVVAEGFRSVLELLPTGLQLRINLAFVLPDLVKAVSSCDLFLLPLLVCFFGLGMNKATAVTGRTLLGPALLFLPPGFVKMADSVNGTGSAVLAAVGRAAARR